MCRWLLGILGLFLASLSSAAPDWVVRAAAIPPPANAGAASAVVLLDETNLEVNASGVAINTRRLVIRILTSNGRDHAYHSVFYLQKHDRVKSTTSWLVRKGKDVYNRETQEWIDVAADMQSTLYSDFRKKAVNRTSEAVQDDVFAVETIVEEPLLTSATDFRWGWSLPVVLERFTLSVPKGFALHDIIHGESGSLLINAPAPNTKTWELHDQPYIRWEADAPSADSKPWLYVRIDPPADAKQFRPAVLQSWEDVSRWLAMLNQGQCDASARLVETAASLAAASPDQMSKIRTLGAYVQKLRYIARNDRLGKGYGYQAHKASQVFAEGYGDCKDKTNLLVAMLREVGVSAFTAGARIGDDREIFPDVPTARQFDHAIAAIQVGPDIDLPAVVNTPRWGRLLFFDPTDPFTMPGDLSDSLQGSRVLVQVAGSDELIQLPIIPPETGHVNQRRASVEFLPGIGCRAVVSLTGHAQQGAAVRAQLFYRSTEEKFRELAVRSVAESLRNAKFTDLVRRDNPQENECGYSFTLTKTGFGQVLPGGMAVVPLDFFATADLPSLALLERKYPLKWPSLSLEDEVELTVPTGFAIEEAPADREIESEFGTYRRTLTTEGSIVKSRRQLTLKRQVVPPADYARLRKFAAEIAKADRASLLIAKRP